MVELDQLAVALEDRELAVRPALEPARRRRSRPAVQRGLERGEAAADVVEHPVEDQPHAARVGGGHERVEVVLVAEPRVDPEVVHGVVAVRLRREDRPEQQPVAAELDRVIQPRRQPPQPVPDRLARRQRGLLRAGEAERVHMPEDGVISPGRHPPKASGKSKPDHPERQRLTPAGQRIRVTRLRNHRNPGTACQKQVSARLTPRVPRRPHPGRMAGWILGCAAGFTSVTGGSRDLGFAAAQVLVADGARVVLSAPHEATASSAAARLAQNAAAADAAAWVVADNADPATPGRLIAAAKDRFGRLDGALISVGGSPPGTVATTTDQAWRSAFESVFLGAVRLARILAADLGGRGDGGAVADSGTGAGASIVFALASSVRVPLADWPSPTGCSRVWPGWSRRSPANSARPGSGSTGCCRSGSPPTGSVNLMPCSEIQTRCAPACRAHPAAQVRRARGVRPGCRLLALPRRVLHHGRDDPG